MKNQSCYVTAALVLVLAVVFLFSIPGAEAVKQGTKAKQNIKVTFLEIGSVNCTPCKMMKPVMKEIEDKYSGKVAVVFYDVSGSMGSMVARQYGVNMIPTQVFLDDQRKEFFRHVGFYPASEISKVIDKKLGKNAGNI